MNIDQNNQKSGNRRSDILYSENDRKIQLDPCYITGDKQRSAFLKDLVVTCNSVNLYETKYKDISH
jgi:hypothetical protein